MNFFNEKSNKRVVILSQTHLYKNHFPEISWDVLESSLCFVWFLLLEKNVIIKFFQTPETAPRANELCARAGKLCWVDLMMRCGHKAIKHIESNNLYFKSKTDTIASPGLPQSCHFSYSWLVSRCKNPSLLRRNNITLVTLIIIISWICITMLSASSLEGCVFVWNVCALREVKRVCLHKYRHAFISRHRKSSGKFNSPQGQQVRIFRHDFSG